jgi:hypothetical protein
MSEIRNNQTHNTALQIEMEDRCVISSHGKVVLTRHSKADGSLRWEVCDSYCTFDSAKLVALAYATLCELATFEPDEAMVTRLRSAIQTVQSLAERGTIPF